MPAQDSRVNITVEDYETIDFARWLHMTYDQMETQIIHADRKAQLILSASAILLAILANFGLGIPAGDYSHASPLEIAIIIVNILMLIALLTSLYFALSVAFPRAGTPPGGPINVLYPGHIAHLSEDEYLEHFMALSLQEVKSSIIRQIHAQAGIVQAKFLNVRRSMVAVFIAVVLWTIARVLTSFI